MPISFKKDHIHALNDPISYSDNALQNANLKHFLLPGTPLKPFVRFVCIATSQWFAAWGAIQNISKKALVILGLKPKKSFETFHYVCSHKCFAITCISWCQIKLYIICILLEDAHNTASPSPGAWKASTKDASPLSWNQKKKKKKCHMSIQTTSKWSHAMSSHTVYMAI